MKTVAKDELDREGFYATLDTVAREGARRMIAVTIEAPRVNDTREVDGKRQKFRSARLPPYLRRSKKVSELLPALYLRALSTGELRADRD